MSRNVYDQAHLLAASLKDSPEYADYRLALAGLKAQKQTLGIFRDYRKRQFQLQSRLLQGEEIEAEERERFTRLSELIAQHGPISAFLSAEYRLSRLLGDIQKIIADAVEITLDVDLEEEGGDTAEQAAPEDAGEEAETRPRETDAGPDRGKPGDAPEAGETAGKSGSGGAGC